MKKVMACVLLIVMIGGSLNLHTIQTNASEAKVGEGEKTGDIVNDSLETGDKEDISTEKEDLNKKEETDIESDNNEVDKGKENIDENTEVSNPENNDRANSWRFIDGVLSTENSGLRSARAYNPNATRTGIDVSEHQGLINWEQVKAAGIDYAIIRCGYGMNQLEQDDDYWVRNVSECERLGIPYGVYIYSYATDTNRALSEAQHVLRLISGHNLSYPVYFDMEDQSTINANVDLASIAQVFCNTISNAGYAVGVYANLNWWNNYLTNPCFSQWHRWVAQYNSTCNYNGDYAIWQYTSEGQVTGISGYVDMNYLIGYPDNHGKSMAVDIPSALRNVISYSSHVEDRGWVNEVQNGFVSGTIGVAKKIEALNINFQSLEGVSIEYQTYVKGEGWQNFVPSGNISGTTGQNKPIEAMRIKLSGENANKYHIYYRTHVQNFGWLDWATEGNIAGTIGYEYQMEAFQIALLPIENGAPGNTLMPFKYKENSVGSELKVHVSNEGWKSSVANGEVAGTVGKALGIEAFSLKTNNEKLGVKYSSYVKDVGWQDSVENGSISGTIGKVKSIEAVKIELEGLDKDNYHIYYRTHSSGIGWQAWTQDGKEAGTQGYLSQVEAIQVIILPKDSEYAPLVSDDAFMKKGPGVAYSAHVQDLGWQQSVENGRTAGSTGNNKHIEAFKINLINQDFNGDIEYNALVQNSGWQKLVKNGNISGTTGKNKPVEAISVKLNGEMEQKYDIYYRVHASQFGWLGWAKNGEKAGSEGYGRQVEAIETLLVNKGSAAPGNTEGAFIIKENGITYRTHVQDIGWQDFVQDGVIAGTVGKNKHLEAFTAQIDTSTVEGGIEYSSHVADIGWQEYYKNGAISGTIGKNKRIEAVQVKLFGDLSKKYDIYYRVHSSDFGWLGWAKNGEKAGSEGYGRQAEAIQIQLVEKGGDAPGTTGNAFHKK